MMTIKQATATHPSCFNYRGPGAQSLLEMIRNHTEEPGPQDAYKLLRSMIMRGPNRLTLITTDEFKPIERGTLFVTTHTSWGDGPGSKALLVKPRMIAAQQHPILTQALRWSNAILVEPGSTVVKTGIQELKKGTDIWLAPAGLRPNPLKLAIRDRGDPLSIGITLLQRASQLGTLTSFGALAKSATCQQPKYAVYAAALTLLSRTLAVAAERIQTPEQRNDPEVRGISTGAAVMALKSDAAIRPIAIREEDAEQLHQNIVAALLTFAGSKVHLVGSIIALAGMQTIFQDEDRFAAHTLLYGPLVMLLAKALEHYASHISAPADFEMVVGGPIDIEEHRDAHHFDEAVSQVTLQIGQALNELQDNHFPKSTPDAR